MNKLEKNTVRSIYTEMLQESLKEIGSKETAKNEIIGNGDTIYGTSLKRWDSNFQLRGKGEIVRKGVFISTVIGPQRIKISIPSTCPFAAGLINIQSDTIIEEFFKNLEDITGISLNDTQKESAYTIQHSGSFNLNCNLEFRLDRRLLGLKGDDMKCADFIARMLDPIVKSIETLDTKVVLENTSPKTMIIPIL